MRPSKPRFVFKGLAFGPVFLALIGSVPALAASPEAGTVYSKVIDAEARIGRAIAARDGKAVASVAGDLGHLIDGAIARRDKGQAATACDMAAHSLGYVAVSIVEGLADSGEARRTLFDDARSAYGDFRTDIQACEKYLGRKTGPHTSVEKALRAL
ncbi:MAG: hypothetical protein ACOH2J_20225 [Allorhizobium sp.]